MGRAHGLGGEVVVAFVSNRPERAAPGAVLTTAEGTRLVVASSRATGTGWLVRFAGVESRPAAEALRGTLLFAEPIADDEAWWVHELIGAEVVDGEGEVLGVVRSVVANPASDLLELEDGGLVPLRFVVARSGRRLVIDAPPGLLDPPPGGGTGAS